MDVFDRERVFIERVLDEIIRRFPVSSWCWSTLRRARRSSTSRTGPSLLAATITAHHLLLNRNALFQGGLQPHHYCLPLLKTEADRRASVQAATSWQPQGFSSAPPARRTRAPARSGLVDAREFTPAHAALELYAEALMRRRELGSLSMDSQAATVRRFTDCRGPVRRLRSVRRP